MSWATPALVRVVQRGGKKVSYYYCAGGSSKSSAVSCHKRLVPVQAPRTVTCDVSRFPSPVFPSRCGSITAPENTPLSQLLPWSWSLWALYHSMATFESSEDGVVVK